MKGTRLTIRCPSCGGDLISYDWGYGCSGYRDGCSFHIGKIAGRYLSEDELRYLIVHKKSGMLDGFRRKDGSVFSSELELVRDEKDCLIVRFRKRPSEKAEHTVLTAVCPKCRGKMVNGDHGWKCENGCGVFIPYSLCGRRITEREAESIIWKKGTLMLNGFTARNGRSFNAYLGIGPDGKVKFCFPDHS